MGPRRASSAVHVKGNTRQTKTNANAALFLIRPTTFPLGNMSKVDVHRSGLLAHVHPTRRAFPSRLGHDSDNSAAFVPITVAGRRKTCSSFPRIDAREKLKCRLQRGWLCPLAETNPERNNLLQIHLPRPPIERAKEASPHVRY